MSRIQLIVSLLCIVLLGAFFRLYLLGSHPVAFLDEMANGYNAFSILKTGRDEYGVHLPVLLRAFDDFRPAMFVYLIVPFVAVFDLSLFSIRIPSVLLSIGAIPAMYVIGKELFGYRKKPFFPAQLTGLSAALFFAISPWNIYSSRFSNEVNMSLAVAIYGTALLLFAFNRGIMSTRQTIFASVAGWVLLLAAFYSYHGAKFFIPFFALSLIVLFWKELWSSWKVTISTAVLCTVLLIPLGLAFLQPGAAVRLGAVNIFEQNPDLIAKSAQRVLESKEAGDVVGEWLSNRRVMLAQLIVTNYLTNFNPVVLFSPESINKSFAVTAIGPLYMLQLPLILIGIFWVTRTPEIDWRKKLLLLLWGLFAVIPSAISSEPPQFNRSNNLLPALTLLTGAGMAYLLVLCHGKRLIRWLSYGIALIAIFIAAGWWYHSYFVLFPRQTIPYFQYEIDKAFLFVKDIEDQFDYIVVSNGENLSQSYSFYLFTRMLDPHKYLASGGTSSGFFTDTHLIGKYDFRRTWQGELNTQAKGSGKKILYIVNPNEVDPFVADAQRLEIINRLQYPNGKDAIWIMKGIL
jgi:4-amino-4-deoxy-L-arabinose transferase-like glycosyltransferase